MECVEVTMTYNIDTFHLLNAELPSIYDLTPEIEVMQLETASHAAMN